ncbi:hypothetical protein Despr_0481 [Desulfobulbus propionicus DSM 2032]|uniref:Uncharacterized protein n=1 Tax=Desulfobulbus propionicus (strain ATCC 33891 / DSM 2032 / VKM B-1956 / 1pr3) TaxID=577650 RepID=A0A7U4DN46_DESPD|nr:hypothetical protein Despr_0481 [Desulfobulbus propionicus DSM 2032]
MARKNRQRVKAIIFWLGVRGVLPVAIVEWIIRKGGMKHD